MWLKTTVNAAVSIVNGFHKIRLVKKVIGSITVYEVHLSGRGQIRDVTLSVQSTIQFSEVFLTAPNFNDIKLAHPSQTLYQGLGSEHDDALFGRQWMFSPPPMVFPVRTDNTWYGFGLGAPPALNNYSGWTYRPLDGGSFVLEIHYDGYLDFCGHLCSVFFFGEGKKQPSEVISAYSEILRDFGWAPRRRRETEEWWQDTFFFPWGEQCNLSKLKSDGLYYTGDIVTMYDTQANNLRWFHILEEHNVPVGVVCTSDKWQLERQRMIPDLGKYPDLRGFSEFHHKAGRHVLAWIGLWRHDNAPSEWCLRSPRGEAISLDPESYGYSRQLQKDIEMLVSPRGYDFDGLFIDFTAEMPIRENLQKAGSKWGLELLHHYVSLIYDAAKSVKQSAMLMTHCAHPYFADVTDVLRLNDWSFKQPNLIEQARYRHSIAKACSDWLINTDNWFMYDINQWREYLTVAPELGIPATWYAIGVWGDGRHASYEAFTEADYTNWASIWRQYRKSKGLGLNV